MATENAQAQPGDRFERVHEIVQLLGAYEALTSTDASLTLRGDELFALFHDLRNKAERLETLLTH